MSEHLIGSQTNQRWEQILRYRYIELIALWEGKLTTRQLCETFGIGRQQANKEDEPPPQPPSYLFNSFCFLLVQNQCSPP